MALRGSRLCCSICRNLFPLDPMEDELTRDLGLVKSPHSGSISPALSYNLISGPNLVPTLVPAPVPALVPASATTPVATNDLFKQFMKAYLESNQRPRQSPTECKRPFKAKVPELYYNKLHMDCYHFCQQCKDYFETAGATGANWTPFAAFFFCRNIGVRWTQYKHCYLGEKLTLITWTDFKAFLQKNLEESKSFIDSIWKKLKWDSQYQLEEVYN